MGAQGLGLCRVLSGPECEVVAEWTGLGVQGGTREYMCVGGDPSGVHSRWKRVMVCGDGGLHHHQSISRTYPAKHKTCVFSILRRLAIIPLSQEARGLDAGPRIVQRMVSQEVVALPH